jgi:WD40 repeat protein
MNGRGVCLSVLQLPGQQSHLTSFHWDTTGRRLVTTVATGHVVLWEIEVSNPLGVVGYNDPTYSHSLVSAGIRTSCRAVLDGGHVMGRPLYGCNFIENDQLLISYGSDGRLCLWDSNCVGEVHEPIAILWDGHQHSTMMSPTDTEGYPIFAVSVTTSSQHQGTIPTKKNDDETTTIPSMSTIVIAGGGSGPSGMLGVPVHLQDIHFL